MPLETEQSKEASRRSWAIAMSVGWELAAFSLLAFAAGYWIDKRFGSSPWGVLIFTLAGIGLGLWRFVRTFTRPPGGSSRG